MVPAGPPARGPPRRRTPPRRPPRPLPARTASPPPAPATTAPHDPDPSSGSLCHCQPPRFNSLNPPSIHDLILYHSPSAWSSSRSGYQEPRLVVALLLAGHQPCGEKTTTVVI